MGFGFDQSMEREGAESAFWWPRFSLFHCLTGTFAEGHTSRAAGKDLDQNTFFLFAHFQTTRSQTTDKVFFVACFLSFRAMFCRDKSQVQTGGVVEHPRLRWCAAEFAYVISRVPSGTCGCGDLCDHRVRFTQDLSES